MPNTQSAKKALRQSDRRRVKSLSTKRTIKKVIKHYGNLVRDGKLDDAKNQLQLVYKILDKAAKAGVIKKNKASRLKSRLSAKLKTTAPSSAPEGNVE